MRLCVGVYCVCMCVCVYGGISRAGTNAVSVYRGCCQRPNGANDVLPHMAAVVTVSVHGTTLDAMQFHQGFHGTASHAVSTRGLEP